MRYRRLAAFPFAWALAQSTAAVALGGRAGEALSVGNEMGKALAAVGCLAAAFAFDREDYLFRAWLFTGNCYALLLASDAVGSGWLGVSPAAVPGVRGALGGAANVSATVGIWMLAHAWRAAGLDEDPDERARGRRWLALSFLGSLGVTGWPLVHDVGDLLAGRLEALVSVGSDLGDLIGLALIAPLARTVLAMRGGLLRWPWAFLTAGSVAWVFYDVSTAALAAAHVEGGVVLVFSESFRALATAFFFSAGVAQRWTMRAEPDA